MAYDHVGLGMAHVLLGHEREARSLFEQCLEMTQPIREHWIRALALWTLGIEYTRVGDQEGATAAHQERIRLRLPLDDRRSIGLNLTALGWCAAATGEFERAACLFGAADAVWQSLGTSFAPFGHLAEMQTTYEAAARQSLGDSSFRRAFTQGVRLSFPEAVAYALGETPPSPVPVQARSPSPSDSLTRREIEVAELITRGLSNRHIASTLVISQRTAEAHVEHISTKLGFTSRAQVAAWFTDRRHDV